MEAKTNTHKKHNPLLLVLMRALYRVGERLLRLQQADPWVGASSGCWRALDPRQTQGHANVPGRTEASLSSALQCW